jgi:ribosomal protein S18 acetylase RimI-like enzyme
VAGPITWCLVAPGVGQASAVNADTVLPPHMLSPARGPFEGKAVDQNVIIRQATPDDAQQLAKLRWEMAAEEESALTQDEETFTVAFLAFVPTALSRGWTVFVAEVNGNLVSNIWLYEVPKVPRPDRYHHRAFGYMGNVYTLKAFRNHGIGAALLDEVVTWGRQQEYELLIVWPSDDAPPFFRRAGFQKGKEEMELYF